MPGEKKMKTTKYHINTLLTLASLAITLLTVSCSEVPASAKDTSLPGETEDTVEAVSWTAWDDYLTVIGPLPIDLITNGFLESENTLPITVYHATQFTYIPLELPELLPELERTAEKVDNVTFALTQAFVPCLVTDDLISLARMNPAYANLDGTFRMGRINSVNYDWFSLSAHIDDARLAVVGLPDEGLIEVCIIDDYIGLNEFNDLAHYYFNISENENAVDDYRPTRFAWTPAFGPGHADPYSCETVGYIIKIGEGKRTGVVRSYTREFINGKGEIFELTTLELSLKYFE